jgi:hypothetical protein
VKSLREPAALSLMPGDGAKDVAIPVDLHGQLDRVGYVVS